MSSESCQAIDAQSNGDRVPGSVVSLPEHDSPEHDSPEHDLSEGDSCARGSVAVVFVALCTIILSIVLVIVGCWHVLLQFHRGREVTDLAALVAADAARGLTSGVPCDLAGEVVNQIPDATLAKCESTAWGILVTADVPLTGFTVRLSAHAGVLSESSVAYFAF